ncbi:MAG: sigma-70 family RNA polymerase sigma factor [Balneolaceae bacterium]
MKDKSSPQKTDIELYLLVLRCQAGDENAFQRLHKLFSDKTLRYLKGLLNKTAAWDIQQEVWLSVYLKISELMNPKGFRTWLYRLTHNKAIDYLRWKKKRLDLKEDLSAEFGDSNFEWFPDEIFEVDDTEKFKAVLKKLSANHREVILLKYWEGMSYEEIALIVGCPVGTVRSQMYYAKQKIKELLDC